MPRVKTKKPKAKVNKPKVNKPKVNANVSSKSTASKNKKKQRSKSKGESNQDIWTGVNTPKMNATGTVTLNKAQYNDLKMKIANGDLDLKTAKKAVKSKNPMDVMNTPFMKIKDGTGRKVKISFNDVQKMGPELRNAVINKSLSKDKQKAIVAAVVAGGVLMDAIAKDLNKSTKAEDKLIEAQAAYWNSLADKIGEAT